MKTTLLIPTLNEIVGMKAIMPQIKPDWVDQIVIVDGGSKDGTVEYAKDQGYFVCSQKEPGLRNGYLEAMPYIEGDVVITLSPDGNCLPELIPPLIQKMAEGYDLVIVSRYLGEAKSNDDDVITGFGNWLFTTTVNLLHGGHYTDVMGIYRAYRKQIIYDLALNSGAPFELPERLFGAKGVGWEPLLAARAARKKLKIGEIPGDEPKRIGGARKLQVLRWGAVCYWEIIRDCFPWK